MPIRSVSVPGLIIDRDLTAGRVTSLSMTFEPSLGVMARRVDKLGMDIRSFREPLRRVLKQIVIPSIAMNFHKHGRTESGAGNAWAPLSEETIDKKGHARPLLLTGALQNTMRRENIWHIDGEKLLLANLPENVWYGVVHQSGTGDLEAEADVWFDPILGKNVNVGDSDGVNIPPRPFVRLTDAEVEEIDEVFLDWLDERALHAGLPTTARSKILSGDF